MIVAICSDQCSKRNRGSCLPHAGTAPLLLAIDKTCIHIAGGMHRFHLVVACGAGEMPFLVEPAALAAIVALLPSVRVI